MTTKTEDEPIVIPTGAADLEVMLSDSKKMQNVFADKDLLGEFISNYARTVLDKDISIATQVREDTQRVLAGWLRENAPEDLIAPVNFGSELVAGRDGATQDLMAKQGLFNPRAMGAAIDTEFTGSADYFRSIWHNTNRDAKLQAKIARIRNAFSSTVPSEG